MKRLVPKNCTMPKRHIPPPPALRREKCNVPAERSSDLETTFFMDFAAIQGACGIIDSVYVVSRVCVCVCVCVCVFLAVNASTKNSIG